jgi:hypothetical protein
MRWIVFTLWLLLTPIWISYSSSAGSGSKVAFIPPALVLIALVFNWLRRRLVLHFAGEFEPSRSIQWSTPGRLILPAKGTFHPAWGFALPSSGILRMALVAAAAGVCAGAVVGQSTYKAAVSNRSVTQLASQEKLPISGQPEAVKSSFAEPKKGAGD